jgi:hypothetical protein
VGEGRRIVSTLLPSRTGSILATDPKLELVTLSALRAQGG